MCLEGLMKFHHCLLKILKNQNVADGWKEGWMHGWIDNVNGTANSVDPDQYTPLQV